MQLPRWITELDDDDLTFLYRFAVGSGSLKALANDYRVSYPTVRARLDRLIAKLEAAADPAPADPFERRLAVLVADGQVTREVARALLDAYAQATGDDR
jgi:hypothetical protein